MLPVVILVTSCLIGSALGQFGPLPSKTCAGGLVCPSSAVCPADFADPAGNLQATVASGLRDFSLEGRINAIDLIAGVAQVNGIAFETSLLDGGKLDTGKLASDTPTRFSDLRASDIGSTLIVVGHFTRLASGCIQMQARTVFYEIMENVIVGQLTGVDAANQVRRTGVREEEEVRGWKMAGELLNVAQG